MKYEDASPLQQFLFMGMLTIALKMREVGLKKKEYLIFAEEVWNMMMSSNVDELQKIVNETMQQELEEIKKKYDNSI